MNYAEQLHQNPKKTPAKVHVLWKWPVEFPGCRVFPAGKSAVVFGDWQVICPILQENSQVILDYEAEVSCRNSASPLLDIRQLPARVEPGAILRQGVTLGEDAVILMGAIVNVGARIGANSMVDMGAVIGGGAQVGENCHIGAGAVVAGMIEPACRKPVVIEDGAFIGANAVILEGCRVGKGAVVAAGAVVTADVEPSAVVAGCPARFVKYRDARTDAKTAQTDILRG